MISLIIFKETKLGPPTGKNAGIEVILCLYGYGIYDAKTVSKADYSIDNPAQILSIVCE